MKRINKDNAEALQKYAKAQLFAKGDLSWILHTGQIDIYEKIKALPPTTKQALIFCARRFGKSYLASVLAIETALKKPNSQILFLAPTRTQIVAILSPVFREILSHAPDGICSPLKSEYRYNFSNGSSIILSGAETPESLRGYKADLVIVDESASIGSEDFQYIMKSVLTPMLLHSKGKILHLTTPSPQVNHPLHSELLPQCEANGAFWRKTVWDNPLLTREDVLGFMKDLGGEHSEAFRREALCLIERASSSLIVPEFDNTINVAGTATQSECNALPLPDYANHLKYLTAIDWGGIRDYTGVLLLAYDFPNDTILVLDECFISPNTNSTDIVKQVLEMELRNSVEPSGRVIDAMGQQRVDLESQGLLFDFPVKQEVRAGVNFLRMEMPRVRIAPKCIHTIRTLEYASWDKQGKAFSRSPELGHCDLLATLVYGVRALDRSNPLPRNYWLSDSKAREQEFLDRFAEIEANHDRDEYELW